MRKIRMFTTLSLQEGQVVVLDETAHRHVTTVLRLRVGAPLSLFNGDGCDYTGEIERSDRKQTWVRILQREAVCNESSLKIELYAAILKGEAMDRVVQKSVELGVQKIIPVQTTHTESFPAGARLEKKLEHWQGILIASTMQCGRAVLPLLAPILSFEQIIAQTQKDVRWIFSPHDDAVITHPNLPISDVAILIGPEGGFSRSEVRAAIDAGWQPQRLGPRILRADTAATVAVARAQIQFGDLC
ncbi:MAG: 16S rRNA (uracil(1498)-N(3))-methyltransferase [Cardiobacteriaceae bacterium]|nr:16S rRNA (uracil(1498)-N(3))-methyltransferase [Cardiobacteriaceae bacterium]